MYVRWMAGEEFMEDCAKQTVKRGSGRIMVWGRINAKGVGFLFKVEGRLTGERSINILENTLIPTTHLLTIPNGWIFQQDNATCHTSRLVRGWFKDEKIPVVDLPSQSPDLTPIKNLWDQIKTMVQEQLL